MLSCTLTNINISRHTASSPEDDIISIVCPGEVDGDVVRKFIMRRSSLERSETLLKFFGSKHYRFGCGMTLHFTQTPGLCFSLVKNYLEKGPDRFTIADVVSEISAYYLDTGKRLEIYTRLYKCARQLELGGLKLMVWAVIKEEGSSMTVEHCVTLASFIFGGQGGYGQQLKNWLLGHVKRHLQVLNKDPVVGVKPEITWSGVVETLSPSFKKEWRSLVADSKSRLSRVDEEEDEQEELFKRVLLSLDTADLERATRALRTVKDEKQEQPSKEASPEVLKVNGDKEESDEWEDLDHLCPVPERSRKTDSSKAREILGVINGGQANSTKDDSPRHSSLDLETSKARLVMGINSPSRGTIAGRRKQPALTRAAKSFSNLIRSPSTQ